VNFAALIELGLAGEDDLQVANGNAAAVYATILERLRCENKVSYGELTFFGDTRYSERGRRVLRALSDSAEALFRSKLKMPVDVYEGPAMNHSYHEMIIGFGRGFSTVALSDKQASIKRISYTSDYHCAQWLATQRALADRGRAVVGLTIRDTSERSATTLQDFFTEVSRRLRRRRA
jgi:hypothetical protein